MYPAGMSRKSSEEIAAQQAAEKATWDARKERVIQGAHQSRDYVVTHGKQAGEYISKHGKNAGQYISKHGKEAGAYLAVQGAHARQSATEVYAERKRQFDVSKGLGAGVVAAIYPEFIAIPSINLATILIIFAAAVITLVYCESVGPIMILIILIVTLLNQLVNLFCDAALAIQMQKMRETGSKPTLKDVGADMKPLWQPLMGLTLASWSEYVVALGLLILRGATYLFMLPFRFCLQPFTLERPVAAVDPLLQLTMASTLVAIEKLPARPAVDQAEVYMLRQVGPKPRYTKTLVGILGVTALPIFVVGLILACFSYFAVGFSLMFIAISFAQWSWNLCSHVLAHAHYRLTQNGADDILPPHMAADAYTIDEAIPVVPTGPMEEGKIEEGGKVDDSASKTPAITATTVPAESVDTTDAATAGGGGQKMEGSGDEFKDASDEINIHV